MPRPMPDAGSEVTTAGGDSARSEADATRAKAFAASMLSTLNRGSLCVLIAVGHRTGLFDVLSRMPPSTPEAIARKAELDERYVREWLGAMAAGGVVDVDPEGRLFVLPEAHAACLTRAHAWDNIAALMQYVGLMGTVEDDIVECFRTGGGVSPERQPRFHDVMAEDDGHPVLTRIETHVLPLVPGLADRLAAGIRVLDVGCGSGRVVNRMAGLYPKSHFTGMDLSETAIAAGRREASWKRLENVALVTRDLSDFDATAEPEAFELVTAFDAIHDQPRPLAVLQGVHRTLREDGVFLIQEVRGSSHLEKNLDLPLAPFLYAISTMHCMSVSLAQGGEGLGALMGEEALRDRLARAGFRGVEKKALAGDPHNDWYVVRK